MGKYMKKVMCVLMMSIIMFTTCFQVDILPVQAATSTSYVPITCYTISTGRVNTYSYSKGKYSYTGYIDGATDQCIIQQIKSDGYCKVKYPVSRGYRTAYVQGSKFFVKTNLSANTTKIGSRKTVYRRSNLSQSLGTVYADDNVQIIGTSSKTTQIIYPTSKGYKMGWISGKYLADAEQNIGVADGCYQIKSAINRDYVLDVYGGSHDDGANIQLYKNQYSTNQGFQITKQSDGYYVITAIHSGKALDVENSKTCNGANILQWTQHGSDNQKWKIVKTADGYYSFISKCNGLYLDANGSKAENEVNIQCWQGNGSGAQKFILESVSVDGVDNSVDSNSSSTYDKRQQIVNYELSQLGIGDYRGNNNVKYNTWYYKREINGNGYAWCMAFQSYCADQCGVLYSAVPKEASCSSAIQWYRDRGQFYLAASHGGSYTPQAGDLVFYGNGGSSHVGMIIAPPSSDGYLQVVEGNVRSSNGNYTVQKFTRNQKRRIDSSYVYGYASPSY